ncbi:heme-binding Shp domain-containing protein [Streptococcus castoreus]|uniref:heme-binding Shp domain-containing protein n=1 Tax=Streptococcus castoreus TaxID=254786 RepID=UPI0003FFB462|nr:heme-binding Shp domain-containing protein [Streptococcus castoreus]
MTKAVIKQILQGVGLAVLCFSVMVGQVYADSGKIYSCLIQRDYRHPISVQIEDSGGQNAFEIGQGMVEGTVHGNGMLEVSDSGNMVLTFRMRLADFSGNYHFWVQPGGRGDFQPISYSVTHLGSDSNGTTKDISISLSDVNTVIRGTMFVEPMGREVVFYLSLAGLEEGYTGDMLPQLVTEEGKLQGTVNKEVVNGGVIDDKKDTDQETTKKQADKLISKSTEKSSQFAKKINGKNASKLGLTTSLGQKKKVIQKNNQVPVMSYYLPTLLLLSLGAILYVKKKRKKDDKTM